MKGNEIRERTKRGRQHVLRSQVSGTENLFFIITIIIINYYYYLLIRMHGMEKRGGNARGSERKLNVFCNLHILIQTQCIILFFNVNILQHKDVFGNLHIQSLRILQLTYTSLRALNYNYSVIYVYT